MSDCFSFSHIQWVGCSVASGLSAVVIMRHSKGLGSCELRLCSESVNVTTHKVTDKAAGADKRPIRCQSGTER